MGIRKIARIVRQNQCDADIIEVNVPVRFFVSDRGLLGIQFMVDRKKISRYQLGLLDELVQEVATVLGIEPHVMSQSLESMEAIRTPLPPYLKRVIDKEEK